MRRETRDANATGRVPRRAAARRRPARGAAERESDERPDDGGEGLLRTADVLRRTGITHQILYRYITLGLIEPAVVTETGSRLFKPAVVEFIEAIKSFNQTGYSLRDLKDTFFKDDRVKKLLARR